MAKSLAPTTRQRANSTSLQRKTDPKKKQEAKDGAKNVHADEFGGPIGALFIIVFSHFILYFLWAVLEDEKTNGAVPMELSWYIEVFPKLVWENTRPNVTSVAMYFSFLAMEFAFAAILPGITAYGLPLEHENGRRLPYKINGFVSWLATLAVVVGLHFSGLFRLSEIAHQLGPLLTTAVITADLISLVVYLIGTVGGHAHQTSGNAVYDFFMGVLLNPRLGPVDIKMWAEVRVSWHLLFLLTVGHAMEQYEEKGALTPGMVVILVAHFLYANACAKGEECIPTTFDMAKECFGFMLCYWNLAGVGFQYAFQSRFILKHAESISWPFAIFVLLLLLSAYVVWDQANGQKNRFRMREREKTTITQPLAFPQLPWTDLGPNPKTLKFKSGKTLLVDGWYAYARKVHYTADLVMALCWGLSTGFTHILPYWYAIFFLCMITHRELRDVERCEKKYGQDWETYKNTVPYRFIPFLL